MADRITRSTRMRRTEGFARIRKTTGYAGGCLFKYNGLTAEQFVLAWIRSEFLYPKRLVFRAENRYATALKNTSIKEELLHD